MGKKILLADDSITIQKVIELTFSDEDFDVVTVGKDCGLDDILTHDEAAEDPTLAYLLSRFAHDESPGAVNPFPEPVGVFRAVLKPTYEDQLAARITDAQAKKGKGKVEDLFKAEDVWTVAE